MIPSPARQSWLSECVARVLARLEQRARAEWVIELRHLADHWSTDIAAHYARLRVTQTTPAFWRRLAAGQDDDPAVAVFRQAWHYGLAITMDIDPACFGLLPVAGLAALPVRLCTGQDIPVYLLARRVAGYRDIALLAPGHLVLARAVLLTALARDEIDKRRIQLFRQV
ncbi:PduM family microcompartment protein [Martelella alba]|nr:PduM family microcompartment protein [Martelella alba]